LVGLATAIRQGILAADDASFSRLIQEVGARENWSQINFVPPDLFISSHAFSTSSQLNFGPHLGGIRSYIPDAEMPGAILICPRRSTTRGEVWDVVMELEPTRMALLNQDPLLRWAMGSDGS
jgi:hypothetical protein